MNQSELKSLLKYDPETGVFTWLSSRCNVLAGSAAGTLQSGGYVQIRINRKKHYAHRLAFLFMDGSLPNYACDHINGIKNDNRWLNLRHATREENGHNAKVRATNTSGVKGVCWHKKTGKWMAQIRTNSKNMYIGLFDSLESAESAVRAARIAAHGEFANHG